MEELLRGLSKEEREFLLNALASCKNETEIREVLSGANLSATAAQVRMILERVLGEKKAGQEKDRAAGRGFLSGLFGSIMKAFGTRK